MRIYRNFEATRLNGQGLQFPVYKYINQKKENDDEKN